MRFSVVLSFMVAIILAAGAVYGTREWLAAQRYELLSNAGQTPVDTTPKETIVVATEQISFGERLIANKLQEISWSGSIRPEGSYKTIAELVADDSEETARFALTAMAVGEPILTSKITAPGVRAKLSTALTPGQKAVSMRVNDVLGVAGFVLPGDRVDVLLTRDDYVDILLQGVKVLAIDQIADDRKDQPSVVRTVTFEVNTTEAQKLTLGAQVGTLSLALRNLASTEIEPNLRVTMQDLSDFDVAEDLIDEQVVEARAAEQEAENTQRFASLESLISSMAGDLTDRLSAIEAQRQQQEQAALELPALTLPRLEARETKVGVIRNGERVEYKVATPNDAEDLFALKAIPVAASGEVALQQVATE